MVRKYLVTDRMELVNLLRLNTPAFFDYSEEKEFNHYLENDSGNYFVVEHSGVIVGCGGINYGFNGGSTVRLSWDLIHPDYQGKGFGKMLVLYRLNEIKKNNHVRFVVVRTTQFVHGFYEKLGFVLERTQRDFWAKSFDLYQMTLDLKKVNLKQL